VAQFDARGVWAGSVPGRLIAFSLTLWENSLIGRGLSAAGQFVSNVFTGSVLGGAFYGEWPAGNDLAESQVGHLLGSVERGMARAGAWAQPYAAGAWETSLLGRLFRWVVRTLEPLVETSMLAQAAIGYAADVEPAPAEVGARVTSPLVYLLGAVLGVIPLIPSSFTGVLSPTTLMIVGVWGVTALWLGEKLIHGNFRWRGSPVALPLLALLVVAGASAVQSYDVGASTLSFVIWLTAGLLFFLVVNLVRNSRDAAALLGPILAGGVLMGLWALYQFKNPPVVTENWVDPTQGKVVRVFAGFMNPNYLAEYMVLFLPPAIALWFQNPRRRLQLAVPIGFMLIALLLTQSRAGWGVFLIALVVMVLLRARRYSFLLAIAGVLGVVLAPAVLPASVMRRILSAFDPQDTSNKYRISLYLGVWAMIKENWVLGAGLGAEAFGKMYQNYMLPEARAAHAHNTYLQMLAEMGVFGVTAVLWTLWDVIRRTFTGGANPRNALLIAAVPASLLALLAHGMVEHIWYNPKLLFAFWAVAGLGMGLLLGDREDAAA
jgi:putative inorganic carbon (HCO3(-)) transporter